MQETRGFHAKDPRVLNKYSRVPCKRLGVKCKGLGGHMREPQVPFSTIHGPYLAASTSGQEWLGMSGWNSAVSESRHNRIPLAPLAQQSLDKLSERTLPTTRLQFPRGRATHLGGGIGGGSGDA
jgi:hypothetical protein